jgi:hypothetical protein
MDVCQKNQGSRREEKRYDEDEGLRACVLTSFLNASFKLHPECLLFLVGLGFHPLWLERNSPVLELCGAVKSW